MGMGGGGSSGATLAHVHDNGAGQGGPLSALTLVGTELLDDITPYRVLDNHIATGAESSHTFTPATALDFDDISKILIVIDIEGTGAGDLEFTINGLTSNNYMISGYSIATGVYSDLTSFNQPNIVIKDLTANQQQRITITILKAKAGSDNEFGGEINVYGQANGRLWLGFNWSNTLTQTTLTEIRLAMSASTWKEDTRITMYGLNR